MSDVNEAVEFLRHATDAESMNRQMGLECLQFSFGEQWPAYAVASRGLDRPQLTLNETNTLIKRITNAQRRQRPRGKASPVDSFADTKVAKVITGLLRHIEVNSDADNAYDTAFDFAARIGWGYWRLRHDYISESSRDQDIFIDCIDNPFCVYYDWNSRLPDGSDAEGALITDLMSKELFKKKYPGAQESNFNDRGLGDSDPDWVTERDIRIAEFFKVERTKAKLVYLSNGENLWADQMPPAELLAAAGIRIVGDRESFKRKVIWRKQTAFDILEEKPMPGKWIPVVPVYWTNVVIDNRRMKFGLVKDAMDPARMNNFWWTAMTESLALAPKAKWLGAEGFDEGHEKEFSGANVSPNPVLRFKTTGVDGQTIPPPERIQPEPPPQGLIAAGIHASDALSKVMGVFDPATRQGAQHKSDKTLNAERGQSENTNFDGYDNLTRSMKHTYRIALSWVPTTYDTPGRVQRIIGEDGKEKMVKLNERQQQAPDATGEAIEKVLNDVCVGTYDVVMETGPSFDTLRQEGVNAMIQLMDTPLGEKVAATADDVIVRSMDFPNSDLIADRLAAANPLSQVDEESEIPPAVQMKMKQMGATIQDLQGKLQQAGLEKMARTSTAEIKAHADILKTRIGSEGEKEEREIKRRQAQHDTEMRATTAQNVAEIKGLVELLKEKLRHGHNVEEALLEFEHAVNMKDREQQIKASEEEPQMPSPTVQ